MTKSVHQGFPDPSSCPEDSAGLVARWEAVLTRAPRLRPWLEEMIRRRRTLLHESARGSVERALWAELSVWIRQFEALPQFAVSAISVTLEEKEQVAKAAPEPLPGLAVETPERAAGETEALLGDPAFALAFHCIEVKLRPALIDPPPAWAWFGMLHASARPQPVLTPAVAVGLVLRVLGADWHRLPAMSRKAALRLFHATAGDLRAVDRVHQLCEALPPDWKIVPETFAAAAGRARAARDEASALCARIAAAARPTQRGGLSVLQAVGAPPAGPEEVAQLLETARKFASMTGLRRLLALL